MTAIRLGIEGRYELAVGAVIVAVVLDAIDGRLARLLKGTSRFGAELDSLADFVNFGVAPAILDLCLVAASAAQSRLDRRALPRHLLRAPAGALQCRDR